MTSKTETPYLTGSPWTGAATTVVFLSWFAGGVLGGLVAAVAGEDPLTSPVGLAIVIAFQSAAAIGAIVAYSFTSGTRSLPADVGLRVHPSHWYGILLGFALQWGVSLVLFPLIEVLHIENESQAVSDVAASTSDPGGRVLLFFSFVIAAPIAEELLFRGVLLGWLSKRFDRTAAVLISGVVFGFVHWEGPDVLAPVIGLMLIGIALGYVATRYGDLSMSILMHAGINLLAFLVLVFEDQLLDWLDELQSSLEPAMRLIGF